MEFVCIFRSEQLFQPILNINLRNMGSVQHVDAAQCRGPGDQQVFRVPSSGTTPNAEFWSFLLLYSETAFVNQHHWACCKSAPYWLQRSCFFTMSKRMKIVTIGGIFGEKMLGTSVQTAYTPVGIFWRSTKRAIRSTLCAIEILVEVPKSCDEILSTHGKWVCIQASIIGGRSEFPVENESISCSDEEQNFKK